MVNIALFGGTGGCGPAFLKYALAANHNVILQTRTPSKVTIKHNNLLVVKGDGTSVRNVMGVIHICAGCDVVVSCAGSSTIMESLANNIVAACHANDIKRCYFITSLGMGGSSPLVRYVLGCIVSEENIHDCEAADKIILDAGFTPIRPTELTDEGTPIGKYNATSETGVGIGALHKDDVGLFICDEMTNNEWGGRPVQLYRGLKIRYV